MGTNDRMSARAVGFAAVTRGAFRGFGVLLVGGLIAPAVDRLVPGLGYVWLPLIAVVAFAVAAVTALPPGSSLASWRQAPFAAVLSYALILPLVQAGAGRIPPLQLALTTLTAILVGALAGLIRVVGPRPSRVSQSDL